MRVRLANLGILDAESLHQALHVQSLCNTHSLRELPR